MFCMSERDEDHGVGQDVCPPTLKSGALPETTPPTDSRVRPVALEVSRGGEVKNVSVFTARLIELLTAGLTLNEALVKIQKDSSAVAGHLRMSMSSSERRLVEVFEYEDLLDIAFHRYERELLRNRQDRLRRLFPRSVLGTIVRYHKEIMRVLAMTVFGLAAVAVHESIVNPSVISSSPSSSPTHTLEDAGCPDAEVRDGSLEIDE